MSGNVCEWVWDSDDGDDSYLCGGGYDGSTDYCEVDGGYNIFAYDRSNDIGFRVIAKLPRSGHGRAEASIKRRKKWKKSNCQ
jgi:hypothetical protein